MVQVQDKSKLIKLSPPTKEVMLPRMRKQRLADIVCPGSGSNQLISAVSQRLMSLCASAIEGPYPPCTIDVIALEAAMSIAYAEELFGLNSDVEMGRVLHILKHQSRLFKKRQANIVWVQIDMRRFAVRVDWWQSGWRLDEQAFPADLPKGTQLFFAHRAQKNSL